VRVPHRDPRRDRKAIDRAARSRELTPEEQILALHSVIGNAAVAGLLGHGAATGTADAKGAEYADGKSEAATADAKRAEYADGKSEAATADAKAADYADGKSAEYADGKSAEYADGKSEAATADAKAAEHADGKGAAAGADGKAGSDAQDSKNEVAASTYEIDWLYELRTRKPRS
jgi:hypothetical protein